MQHFRFSQRSSWRLSSGMQRRVAGWTQF